MNKDRDRSHLVDKIQIQYKYKYNRNRNTVEIERQIQEDVCLLACAKAKHPPFLRQRTSPIENKLHLSVQNIYIYVHIFRQCVCQRIVGIETKL